MNLQRIIAAEMLPGLRLRLRFADGFDGVVSLAGTVREGEALRIVRDRPAAFAVTQAGRAIAWTGPDGEEADFCADALRLMAEPAAVRAAE